MQQTISLFDQLKTLRSAKPFEPFVIATRAGAHLVVTEPMSFGCDGKRITVIDGRDRFIRLTTEDVIKIRTVRELML